MRVNAYRLTDTHKCGKLVNGNQKLHRYENSQNVYKHENSHSLHKDENRSFKGMTTVITKQRW